MKKSKYIVKSTKVSNKFSNVGKRGELCLFIDEYRSVLSFFVNELWDSDDFNKFINKDITEKCETWLSARAVQCAAKQAGGIVRGTKEKQRKRKWQIDKFNEEGCFKKARKLQKIYDENEAGKPDIKSVEPELDSRFVEVDFMNETSFDGWITLSSLGNKLKIQIPFKKTRHFNKLDSWGEITNGCRISKNSVTFCFKSEKVEIKNSGEVIGIDVGVNNTISCSNGFQSQKNNHGHDLTTISEILSRKKKGSKSFERAQAHRDNYTNWSINQLNLNNVKVVKLENIKNLRKGKKSNRKLSHWTYSSIFRKLEDICSQQGVLVNKVNPTFTSVRCSCCGWTQKSNRKGKLFKCKKCDHSQDSDLNASLNISFPLKGISKEQRLKRPHLKGFYWETLSQESIVPDVQKV